MQHTMIKNTALAENPMRSESIIANTNKDKDLKEAATDPQFGDVLRGINERYGGAPEKPREIKKTLGKDDFLKIMIAQMKNQDPTNPFKAEQMASEMAQFTSVEQLQNLNGSINKMADKNKPMEKLAMSQLIGQRAVIDKQRFTHRLGDADALSFELPAAAASMRVSIVDAGGEEVYAKDLGAHAAGNVAFTWDGVRSNTLPAQAGQYQMKIVAKNEHDQPLLTQMQSSMEIRGVSFEGAEPLLLVGEEKISMQNVLRIESPQKQVPGV